MAGTKRWRFIYAWNTRNQVWSSSLARFRACHSSKLLEEKLDWHNVAVISVENSKLVMLVRVGKSFWKNGQDHIVFLLPFACCWEQQLMRWLQPMQDRFFPLGDFDIPLKWQQLMKRDSTTPKTHKITSKLKHHFFSYTDWVRQTSLNQSTKKKSAPFIEKEQSSLAEVRNVYIIYSKHFSSKEYKNTCTITSNLTLNPQHFIDEIIFVRQST